MAILFAVGLVVFLILGAVAVVVLSDRMDRAQQRKASEDAADREVW